MATSKNPHLAPKLIFSILLGAIGLAPTSLAQMPGTPTLWHMGNGGVTVEPLDCTSLNGGTWVRVPGYPIYGTGDFCVQKYVPSNASNAPVSRTGTTPWVNINQTAAKTACQSLGTGYHLITNPEWMTIAANLANVSSNWSNGIVGSGVLTRGHSDNNPNSACAADANDANAWVENTCTGQTQGAMAFNQRRTQNLSNGSVIWDFGGNAWQWIDYNNANDKPTPATATFYEYTAITGSTTTPKSHLVPLQSAQSWWTDSWNSSQAIGRIYPGTNGSGGALFRGGSWNDGTAAGPFAANLNHPESLTYTTLSFRCTYVPTTTYTVTYNANGATSGTVPSTTAHGSGTRDVVSANTGNLARSGFTFAGWSTTADGNGQTYAAGSGTFTVSANTTLYAKWITPLDCSGLAGGTWVSVPGDSIYGTGNFCVQKYVPYNASNIPTSSAGQNPWDSISQTVARARCADLGAGYHLITNPEWMTIAANLANVSSNWSNGIVGSGVLTRGHSDNNPNSACAADANDANAWVENTCTGQTQGAMAFNQRRTQNLSNGSVIWDFGGNAWQWVDAYDPSSKPGTATNSFSEYSATFNSTTTWPRSAFVPLNSAQSWWTDTWNSSQSIGQINPGTSGSGGALRRGGDFDGVAMTGVFSANLTSNLNETTNSPSVTSFRCAYAPASSMYTVTYDLNGGTGTTPGVASYSAGTTVSVANTTPTRSSYTFGGWNTQQDGNGISYGPSGTFTMGVANITLYAKWNASGYYSVFYYPNDATSGSVPAAQTFSYNASVTVAANTGNLARTGGYVFAGWNTNAAGTGTNYAAGSGTFVMPASAFMLYAKWNITCGDTAANNCYTGTNSASLKSGGTATTPSGKSLTFTSGVWVEAGAGTRVLAADGSDNWAL